MSKTAKREYVREKSRDYARALSRGANHAIVQEVARTCAFSVKYVIRCLNAPSSEEASAGLPESSRTLLREESSGTHFLRVNRELRSLITEIVRATSRRASASEAAVGAAGAGASPSDSASPPPSGQPRPRLSRSKTAPESPLLGCTSL